eukprot:6491358-Amphidinium_carterae.1
MDSRATSTTRQTSRTGTTVHWSDEYNQNNKVYGLLQVDAQPLPSYGDNIIGDQSQQEANIPKDTNTTITK